MCLRLLRGPDSCSRRSYSQRCAKKNTGNSVMQAHVSIGLSGILDFILSLKIWPSMLTSATCTFCSISG